MNRKAMFVGDVFLITLFLFTLTIVCVVILDFMQDLDDIITMDSTQTDYYNDVLNAIVAVDNAIPIFLAGVSVALMYAAHRLKTVRAYAIIGLFLLGIMAYVLPVLSNTLTEFMDDSGFSVASLSFPILTWVRDNLPLVGVIIGGLVLVALYMKGGDVPYA